MSDKKDLYEDRYVLDDYDTPSFYGKSADKYFGDIDREHKENRRDGISDVNTLYEPTDYLKRRGMSRLEMEYYAGAAGIRNVSGKNDLEAVYKAYVDDKTGGRNKKSIDSLRDDFNEFKNTFLWIQSINCALFLQNVQYVKGLLSYKGSIKA